MAAVVRGANSAWHLRGKSERYRTVPGTFRTVPGTFVKKVRITAKISRGCLSPKKGEGCRVICEKNIYRSVGSEEG